MASFIGNPMHEQDHPLVKAEKGDFFIPLEKEWTSESKKRLWIAIDAAVIIGFVLLVTIVSFIM